jgi:hypothetical protein
MWFKKELPKTLGKIEKNRLQAYIGHSNTDMNLVGQYDNAIDILVNKIIEDKLNIDFIAHPLLYLIRHSTELALKENIRYLNKYSLLGLGGLKTHSIHTLYEEFERHYNEIAINLNFKEIFKDEYEKYANDLRILIKKLGEDWSSFRYVNSTKGNKIFSYSETVDIYDLKRRYDNSRVLLLYTADLISPYTDFIDYIKFDTSVIDEGFGRVLFCVPSFQKESLIEKMNNEYQEVKENKIWFDKTRNYNLHLKIADEKYYIIPIKNKTTR